MPSAIMIRQILFISVLVREGASQRHREPRQGSRAARIDRGEYYLILNDGAWVRLSRGRRAHLEVMLGERL